VRNKEKKKKEKKKNDEVLSMMYLCTDAKFETPRLKLGESIRLDGDLLII